MEGQNRPNNAALVPSCGGMEHATPAIDQCLVSPVRLPHALEGVCALSAVARLQL